MSYDTEQNEHAMSTKKTNKASVLHIARFAAKAINYLYIIMRTIIYANLNSSMKKKKKLKYEST